MAKFSEKDAETLFNRVGADPRICQCRKCGVDFFPDSRHQRNCEKCKTPTAGTLDCLLPKVKKRKRGRPRGASAKLTPDDSGPGKMNKCSMCGWTWYDATRRYTKVESGVEYDYWRCGCMIDGKRKGHEYTRYK